MRRMRALISDCDGVIAETERDGHRVAFNRAFAEMGLEVQWDVAEYGHLLGIAGGKERIRGYFAAHGSPQHIDDAQVRALHDRKTEIFEEMCADGLLPVRPGIKRLFLEAANAGIPVLVCSTSHERSVTALVRSIFGPDFSKVIQAILAGDIVKRKKPAPDIYDLAKVKFGFKAQECCVIEDNLNGLMAAKAAGMTCVVTPSFYSLDEDFRQADLVVSSLGDPGEAGIEVRKSPPGFPRDVAYVTVSILEMCLQLSQRD